MSSRNYNNSRLRDVKTYSIPIGYISEVTLIIAEVIAVVLEDIKTILPSANSNENICNSP